VFLATSAKYPPAKPEGGKAGVDLPKGVGVAKSSGVKNGGQLCPYLVRTERAQPTVPCWQAIDRTN
jgi:hypothetical protein